MLAIRLLLLGLIVGHVAAAAAQPEGRPRTKGSESWSLWGGIGIGLLVPFGTVPERRLELKNPFVPALELSILAGAAKGRFGLGGRIDGGVGGLAPDNLDRGLGYLFNFGPVARFLLVDAVVQVNVLVDTTWMRLGTSSGGRTRCSTASCLVPDSDPRAQLGFHAVGSSVALSFALGGYFLEVRYVRPYWYRVHDQGMGPNIREWNFMRVDQLVLSFGVWHGPAWRR